MTFAKGFLLGSIGCLSGCLVGAILLFLVLGLGVSACVSAIPIGLAIATESGVELVLEPNAPSDAVDQIVAELRRDSGSAPDVLVRVSGRDRRHAWLVFGSHGWRRRSRERDRVEAAVKALEERNALPKGSVAVRGYGHGDTTGFSIEFGDNDRGAGLPTTPSKR